MIVDCAHYQDGHRTEEGMVPLEETAARRAEGGFVWLGLFEPGEEELAQVRETFGLHELAIEDALILHRHPKIASYDPDVQLVIVRTARYVDDAERVDFGEISVFVAPTFVITVRQGVATDLAGVRQRLEERPGLLAAGSLSVLWAVLDAVVDAYTPVVLELERDVDDIEATVFSGAIAPTERIYSLRSEATGFYRAVHPLLAVISTVEHTAAKKLRPYLRDVHDHLFRVDEGIADQRETLRQLLEANMAVISVEQTRVNVQQNRTMQQLTILATIFLPLTFITGFFGQNFKWMTDHIESLADFLVFGVCGLAVPLTLLITWMRLRMPRVDTRAALVDAAGADAARPASAAPAALPSAPGPRQRIHSGPG